MKSDKFFNATNSLLIGLSVILIGILMIIGKDKLYIDFINIFLIAILILSIKHFASYFTNNKEKKINFIRSFLNIVFCLVLSLFKNIPLSILPIIFGLYLLLNAIVKYINYIILFKNKSNGRVSEIFFATIYLGLALTIIFAPLKNLNIVLMIVGIYLILLGTNYIIDFIGFITPKKYKNKIRRHIRISLPVFVEAIIPYTVLNEINYLLDKDNYDKPFIYESKNGDTECDMEVFVHTSKRGFNRMGHVDICYKNQVISYGNYDDSSIHFFNMIGDGVFFTTSRDKYIPFCIEHSKKTLFVFGIKLTDKQKNNVEKTIDKIYDNLYEWYPPYVEAKKVKKRVSKKKYGDYASRLYQITDSKFYKFKKGRFKKYFVLGTNCCKLADYIIGKSGTDILKLNGVITPGSYYEYLNREFQKKNSMVISRKIYNDRNVDKKTIAEIFKGFSR